MLIKLLLCNDYFFNKHIFIYHDWKYVDKMITHNKKVIFKSCVWNRRSNWWGQKILWYFLMLLGYYLYSGILSSLLVEYSQHLGWFQLHTDMNPAKLEANTLHTSEGSITSVFSELWHVNNCLIIFNTHKYWWPCKMNIYSPNCIYNTWINKFFGYKNVILQ
jgi:hypothetical protein